jgi:ABC-type Mn2+/Zn2+ transport system ATPase subunit
LCIDIENATGWAYHGKVALHSAHCLEEGVICGLVETNGAGKLMLFKAKL